MIPGKFSQVLNFSVKFRIPGKSWKIVVLESPENYVIWSCRVLA